MGKQASSSAAGRAGEQQEGEMCSVRAFRERGGGERAARVLGCAAVYGPDGLAGGSLDYV